MNERDLENEKLKKAERAIAVAGKLSDAEIENIVAAPQLFARIRESVETEKTRRAAFSKNVFGVPRFRLWRWQIAGLSFAAIAILILSAMFFLKFSPSRTTPEISAEEKQPKEFVVPKQPEQSPQIIESKNSEFQPQRIEARKKATISKNSLPPLIKSSEKRKSSKLRFENQRNEPFIALTYAGNLADEESRIVRVEMTPARLLSLGVAVQTENEAEKIKTDLLVSPDGVARAIRVVK